MGRKMTDDINEERLTAFVLNEVGENERVAIEKALQNDPELKQEADELKMFCSDLTTELREAPLPMLSDAQRRAIYSNLTVEPVKQGFSLKRFFEWKVLVPATCVGVLALALFLKVPVNSFKSNESTVAENNANRGSALVGKISPEVNYNVGMLGGAKTAAGRSNGMQLINNNAGYVDPQYNLANYDIIYRNNSKMESDRASYTVPVNVKTAAYDVVKQYLANSQMPPQETVKSEELINYFDYNYAQAEGGIPFTVITELSSSPWNSKHKLLHIGVKGRAANASDMQGAESYAKHAAAAEDVKIRLEFAPAKIKAYRLIGYENKNRGGKAQSRDSEIYVKELRAGHIATVLYELMPVVSNTPAKPGKIMTLKLGYKLPGKDQWHISIYPIMDRRVQFGQTSDNFRFAAAVAGFGMLLKNSDHNRNMSYNDVLKIAKGSMGNDKYGRRNEFISFVETAKMLNIQN